MAPFSPPDSSLIMPTGPPPTSQQASTLKTLLSPHLRHALSTPPSPDALQYLSVGLGLQAAQTMGDTTKTRAYDQEDLLPLRSILHLCTSNTSLVLPTQLLLDMIIAYPSYTPTIHLVLDNARRGNPALFGEIDLGIVGPSFGLLEEQALTLGPQRRVGVNPLPNGQSTIDLTSRDTSTTITTINKTLTLLLTLSRAHQILTKSILTSRKSLDTLNLTYHNLTITSSHLFVSTNIYAQATPQSHLFADLTRTKEKVLLLVNTLMETLPKPEREWKFGNLEDLTDDPGLGAGASSKKTKTKTVMVDTTLVEDYAIFFPQDESIGYHALRQDRNQGMKVDERIMDILRTSSGSDSGGQAVDGRYIEVNAPPSGSRPSNGSLSTNPSAAATPQPPQQPQAKPTPGEQSAISTIHGIFPHLPAHLLLEGLRHPSFASGSSGRSVSGGAGSGGGEEGLINALLEGSLPKGLEGLGRVLRGEEVDVVDSRMMAERGGSEGMSRSGSGSGSGATSNGNNANENKVIDKGKKPFKRGNIWDEAPMDFAKLRIGKDESALANLTSAIPDHIRSSILRLTEQQQEEEQAELEAERQEASERRERARAAASGSGSDSGSGGHVHANANGIRSAMKVKTVAFEEELEDWERQDMDELGRVVKRPRGGDGDGDDYDEDLGEGEELDEVEGLPGSTYASGSSTPSYRPNPTHNPSWNPPLPSSNPSSSSPYGLSMPDADPSETYCELAYIRDPSLFDRDGGTRRGKAREEMRRRTGWGDEQLEGWRIMLERNPRKDKILSRHGALPTASSSRPPSQQQKQHQQSRKPNNHQQQQLSKQPSSSATTRTLPSGSIPMTKSSTSTSTTNSTSTTTSTNTKPETTATADDWGGGPAVPLNPWDPPKPENLVGFNPRNDGTKRGMGGGGTGKDKGGARRGGYSGAGGGGGGGGEGSGSGSGGGNGNGGRGGGTGNGTGTGQRGQNKGSRGHSNAARTRGHDKKMARMGVV